MNLRKITDLDVSGKVVLLRLDLNLPIKAGKFSDITRITRSIPTINYLLSKQARVVIISHMGRPQGKFCRDLSLAPVADELERCLKLKVKFATDCVGPRIKDKIAKLKDGEVMLLENLRFHAAEELNDLAFAKELSLLGQIYINDTFSCSHRAHASIEAIARFMPSAAGFLLIEELTNIYSSLEKPARPFTAIVGGAKISTKIGLLFNLLDKIDTLILAGAMANTFIYAQGYSVAASMIEADFVPQALQVIVAAEQKNKQLLLPQDFVTQNNVGQIILSKADNILPGYAIMDIGPNFSAQIASVILKTKTVVWNGPLGAVEIPPFNAGSQEVARHIASASINNGLNSVIGGGDTIGAVNKFGLLPSMGYASTGGGAFLQWLEGKVLPGVEVLLSK